MKKRSFKSVLTSLPDLVDMRVTYLRPIFATIIFLSLVIWVIFLTDGSVIWIALTLGALWGGFPVITGLAGLVVFVWCLMESLLSWAINKPRVFKAPKRLSIEEKQKLNDWLASQEQNTECENGQLTHTKKQDNKFLLGVIAGAIGISLLSGCDDE
ncbi:hypothetical protein [Thiomicrorhabdus aquaedulcis]|uniref:hypothetical protein n=1 Tax=Thiomicrorhabdus aquaedulcis TaxID=2211106 RepID=UPI000FD9CEDC|nr:hypothetical protein [Thiomicrorhabdus aquaedulcis]